MTEQKGVIFRFGEFEVREREFCLQRGGERIPVEPKAFRVLLFLLRNPHRLVTKNELLDAVWQQTSVSENSLTRSIALLRRLLGDDTHEPRFIATVPTVGYRLLCEVRQTSDETEETPDPSTTTTTGAERERADQARPAHSSRARLAWLAVAILVAVTISVALFWRFEFEKKARKTAEPDMANAMRVTQLTTLPGLSFGGALSPDGEKLAFFWNQAGPKVPNLYVQLVGSRNPIQLTHDHSGNLCCATWSPDGQQIAFGRCEDSGGGIFVVPALGGPERKLTGVVCPEGDAGYPQWTSDGRSMILADRCTPAGVRGIVRFSFETGDKQCLHDPPTGDVDDIAPALSPDQKTVAFIRNTSTDLAQIEVVPASGGRARVLVPAGYNTSGELMWSPEGDRVIFYSNHTGSMRAWQISPEGGAMQPELEYPKLGSLSRDGRRIVYEGSAGLFGFSDTIWRAELSRAGGAILSEEMVPTSEGQNSGIQISSDGRQVVYQSDQSGETGEVQIWKNDLGGNRPLPLTSFHTGYPGTPRWSPDDRQVAFDYHLSPHGQIYVVDAEGRNLRRITSGDYENVVPSWSRDGNSIYFASNRTGRWQVWKRSLVSGEESQVTRNGGFAALESFDGKTLYYSKFEGGGLWSLNDGDERHLTGAPHAGDWGQFAVARDGVYLIDSWAEGGPTLQYYDLRTRHLSTVLVLKQKVKPWTSSLSATRDGRIVLYVLEEMHGSILMGEKTH